MKFPFPSPPVVALVPVLLLAAGCTRSPSPAAPAVLPPLVIEVTPVALSTEPVPVEVSGVLTRRAEAQLAFKTGGIIATINVRAGDSVAAGQVLATLRLDEIDAAVAQARAAAAKARRDHARIASLHSDRVATLENLQDAASAVEVAEAALRTAEFNRTHSVITASSPGRILRRMAEPEELAAPGRPILAVASDTEGWVVKVGVTEHDVLRLHAGDRAEVTGADGIVLPAALTQLAEGADPATRTVEVELAIDGPVPAGLRSGFIVETRLFPRPVPARPAVPLAAIVEGRGRQAHLFLLSPDRQTVRRQAVEIEAIHGDRAYLRTDLPASALVATTGAEFLSEGRTVVVSVPQR